MLQTLSLRKSEESGVAIIEFIITFPLLFFCILAIVDMSRWIDAYSEASRVAYEGVRYAASLEDLPSAVAIVDPHGEDTIPNQQYARLISRIQRIMDEQGMNTAGASVRLERKDPAVSNIVELQLSVPFEPYSARFLGHKLFGSLGSWTSASMVVSTPYLYSAE